MGTIEPLLATFTHLTEEGCAIGSFGTKKVTCWGVLPGETATVWPIRKRGGILETRLHQIIHPSKNRQPDPDDHHISCSPLAIFPYSEQIEIKQKHIEKLFPETTLSFIPSPIIHGYRTKIEFSMTKGPDGYVPAFHTRGSFKEMRPAIHGCHLFPTKANDIATAIVKTLERYLVPLDAIKTFSIRWSHTYQKGLAVIAATEKMTDAHSLVHILSSIPNIVGIHIGLSPSTKGGTDVQQWITSSGESSIADQIGNIELRYGPASFFQNNIPLMSTVVSRMRDFFKESRNILDLYGGVGTLGLSVARPEAQVLGVEINEASAVWATHNAVANNVINYKSIATPAEQAIEHIKNTDAVIVDPTRAGLHPKVLQTLTKETPKRIAYVSCNPKTLASDMSVLLKQYKIISLAGFDFYPHTPHMEALALLEKK